MRHIRRQVLRLTQANMGSLIGVSQATISRWESGELKPSHDHLSAIRAQAHKQRVEWNDEWFFEAPPEQIAELSVSLMTSETAPS